MPTIDVGYDDLQTLIGKHVPLDELRDKAIHHGSDVMDFYGATNPAEFFAVATETFFDNPHAMKKEHPKLYDELQQYYRLDPEKWITK